MTGVRRRFGWRHRARAAGLILPLATTVGVEAQEPAVLPPAGVVGPAPEAVILEPTAPGVVPPAPMPPPPHCTCGDRRGLSRWRWHRRQCKRHLQETFLGFPEEFNEWPLGKVVYAHGDAQIINAQAARTIFYHYDFIDGTSELNLRGRDKLARIAAEAPTHFFPIIVERTPHAPGLDQVRRLSLLGELAAGPFPVPAERVVIGPPIAHGLRGIESQLINQNLLGQTATGGFVPGRAASAPAAGFDAGGLTGAAVIP